MYTGPIIDAHHHLWDIGMNRHRWLVDAGAAIGALGDISYMRKTYLPADFLADAAGKKMVGTVHIEAHWDRARDPVEETEWLESIDRPGGVASRYIAFAPLTDPAVEKVLERQAAFPRVVGLRETIRWHPDPARSWAEAGLADSAEFRRGVGLLQRYKLALELLMNPYQAEEVARLAGDFPAVTFLINHCATPVDRDAEGIERWKRGLKLMAAPENIAIKVSAFVNFSPNKTLPEIRDNLMPCIDAFGPRRAMFGTDYPVGRRHMSYAGMVEAFEALIAGFSAEEQRALFHDNARRYYRFD